MIPRDVIQRAIHFSHPARLPFTGTMGEMDFSGDTVVLFPDFGCKWWLGGGGQRRASAMGRREGVRSCRQKTIAGGHRPCYSPAKGLSVREIGLVAGAGFTTDPSSFEAWEEVRLAA